MSDWYYAEGGVTHGPNTPDEMRRRLAVGRITPETEVWCPDENVAPTPVKATPLAAPLSEAAAGMRWHYERAGSRVGPVDETEMHRLLTSGTISRDTLVWSPEVGPAFVRLGDTALSPPMVEPPALPASAVDSTLAWVLVAIPIASELLELAAGSQGTSVWGWTLATFAANVGVSIVDEKRVIRSGASDRSIKFGFWLWLVPVYLYQRARAVRGPKYYFWAWIASFVISVGVGMGMADVTSLVSGDTYLGSGVPACDSRYQVRQVRKIFDRLAPVRAAGLSSVAVSGARELGSAGNVRTCAAQVSASNAQSYRVVYTVERTEDQLLTNIQLQ